MDADDDDDDDAGCCGSGSGGFVVFKRINHIGIFGTKNQNRRKRDFIYFLPGKTTPIVNKFFKEHNRERERDAEWIALISAQVLKFDYCEMLCLYIY